MLVTDHDILCLICGHLVPIIGYKLTKQWISRGYDLVVVETLLYLAVDACYELVADDEVAPYQGSEKQDEHAVLDLLDAAHLLDFAMEKLLVDCRLQLLLLLNHFSSHILLIVTIISVY